MTPIFVEKKFRRYAQSLPPLGLVMGMRQRAEIAGENMDVLAHNIGHMVVTIKNGKNEDIIKVAGCGIPVKASYMGFPPPDDAYCHLDIVEKAIEANDWMVEVEFEDFPPAALFEDGPPNAHGPWNPREPMLWWLEFMSFSGVRWAWR